MLELMAFKKAINARIVSQVRTLWSREYGHIHFFVVSGEVGKEFLLSCF